MLQALAHFFGLDNLSGPFYGFWSGVGSDVSELAIVAAVIGMYRRHNCHVKGCPRIGKHPVEGTPYIVCAKHHPDVPERITARHIFTRLARMTHRVARHVAVPEYVEGESGWGWWVDGWVDPVGFVADYRAAGADELRFADKDWSEDPSAPIHGYARESTAGDECGG